MFFNPFSFSFLLNRNTILVEEKISSIYGSQVKVSKEWSFRMDYHHEARDRVNENPEIKFEYVIIVLKNWVYWIFFFVAPSDKLSLVRPMRRSVTILVMWVFSDFALENSKTDCQSGMHTRDLLYDAPIFTHCYYSLPWACAWRSSGTLIWFTGRVHFTSQFTILHPWLWYICWRFSRATRHYRKTATSVSIIE